MGITKVIIERIAVAELAVIVEEAAASGVVQFVIKKVARILFRRAGGRGRLRLELLCACDDGRCDTDNQADKEQSYIFHRLRCGQRCIG